MIVRTVLIIEPLVVVGLVAAVVAATSHSDYDRHTQTIRYAHSQTLRSHRTADAARDYARRPTPERLASLRALMRSFGTAQRAMQREEGTANDRCRALLAKSNNRWGGMEEGVERLVALSEHRARNERRLLVKSRRLVGKLKRIIDMSSSQHDDSTRIALAAHQGILATDMVRSSVLCGIDQAHDADCERVLHAIDVFERRHAALRAWGGPDDDDLDEIEWLWIDQRAALRSLAEGGQRLRHAVVAVANADRILAEVFDAAARCARETAKS